MIQKRHRCPSVSNSRPHVLKLFSLLKWKLLVRWYIYIFSFFFKSFFWSVPAPLRSGLTLLEVMSSCGWWLILTPARLFLSEDERWDVSWGSDGNGAVGKRGRVFGWICWFPSKETCPHLEAAFQLRWHQAGEPHWRNLKELPSTGGSSEALRALLGLHKRTKTTAAYTILDVTHTHYE